MNDLLSNPPPLVYGSVCSGIEAATAAWHPLGWKPAFFSEIEPFPRAVLQHHYPDVPCHGDFTTIKDNDYAVIDLLVGGTPCQAFSVAGLRKGFADQRGNLTLEFIRLAQRLRPRWLVWENVPGVLSIDDGRAFGSFLGGLAECGYGFAYRVLDAQYFGVPQRRRRVFVVGYFGDWRPAAAVLFERDSLRRDITPSRETRESIAPTLDARAGRSGETSFATSGGLIPNKLYQDSEFGVGEYDSAGALRSGRIPEHQMIIASTGHTSHCLNAGGMGRQDYQTETLVILINTMTVQGRPSDLDRMGSGIGNPGDPANTLSKGHSHAVGCFKGGQGAAAGSIGYDEHVAPTLNSADSGSNRTPALMTGMQVRRLTPRECERLQGFEDDFTLVPFRNKPAADGNRYKALGNSMAVPVMRFIGERIDYVRAIQDIAP